MLVVLDESLSSIAHDDFESLAGLESVLASSHNGEHFLTSSFTTIHSLLKLQLSARGHAVLQRLRSNISGHGHLPYPESFVMRIVSDGAEFVRKSNRNWEVPVTAFRNKVFPAAIVLGENMLDAEAYIFGSKQSRTKLKFKEKCKSIPDAGGGSQTAVKLEGYIRNTNGFCFCITDGDYRDPFGNQSAVTSMCQILAEASTWPVYSTDFRARSIENIIPLDLIEDSFDPNPIPKEFTEYRLIDNRDPETTKYLDAKVGLKYCAVLKLNSESPRFTFWRSKITRHNLEVRFNLLSENPPQCAEHSCSKCTLISGLGGGTLKQVVEYFRKQTPQATANRVDAASTWCHLGLNIFHWTMADRPVWS